MTYNPSIPNPGDLLSTSQGDIKDNFSSANTSFGVDHYAFSDLTANNGKHKFVTTPVPSPVAHPVTAADPKFYGMQDTANIGLIQYSRGPNNAAPSPVTYLQSTIVPIILATSSSTVVLDFTGLRYAICKAYAASTDDTAATAKNEALVVYDSVSAKLKITNNNTTATSLQFTGNGLDILSLTNGSSVFARNSVFWTLQFLMVQV